MGQSLHPNFGIAHGCRWVPIDGTKVALTIHQGIAHGKILGQPHDRIINSRITMGMKFTDNITDDAGRFFIRLVPVVF